MVGPFSVLVLLEVESAEVWDESLVLLVVGSA